MCLFLRLSGQSRVCAFLKAPQMHPLTMLSSSSSTSMSSSAGSSSSQSLWESLFSGGMPPLSVSLSLEVSASFVELFVECIFLLLYGHE